ncbi:translocation/assembly module TamB [Gramella lutea]|uniref:Translocation/assembly module TamB n=1 Tax=Christiangramia lutea TaxID=1607951 RepID=A0A9X1V283_9FLAO|nr:translocation/assembly module TamB domain-containing protein [Christiangramia lutea]MCH4823082.1 translocation/assembly module TamB [Christiangramia lutea]
MAKNKQILFKALKILGKIFLGILIFLLLVILFVRSPWGQGIIKDKFISSIEKKTGGEIELEKLFITFDGDIEINELYIETPEGDSLAYAKRLSANIGLWALIKGNSFDLNQLEADDLRARIIRKDSINGFNFGFLTRAYASDTTQTQTPADTTTAPMGFNIGDINLEKIDILYKDQVSGIDSKIKFGLLELEFEETNLENMIFRTQDAILSDAEIDYEQTKPFPESDAEPAPMPVIEIQNLEFSNVSGSYASVPDSISTNVQVYKLKLDNTKFDLKQNSIFSNSIEVQNSKFGLALIQKANTSQVQEKQSQNFEWPDFNIEIAKIDLENNSINYKVNDETVRKGTFNPNAVKLDSLIFKASNIAYEPGNVNSEINELKFQEASGIEINNFNFKAQINEEAIRVADLEAGVNNNRLSGRVEMTYSSLNEFIQNPGTAGLNINIDQLRLSIKDIFRFQPELEENEYLKALAASPVRGNLNATGTVNDINLSSLALSWSDSQISGNGYIRNSQDPENLKFNLPQVRVSSKRSDILKFVAEEDLGMSLPEEFVLAGSFSGDANAINTNSLLQTTSGNIEIEGEFQSGEQIAFDTEIKGDSIALGKLLQNEALGNISLKLKASGEGKTMNDLDAELETVISSFDYNGYEFREIQITGDLENGKGPVTLDYKDNNLNMTSETRVQLDSVSPKFDVNLNIKGANLEALGITKKEIKTGFVLNGWYEGNAEGYELEAEIIDGVAVYNNQTYLLGSLDASAFVREDTTSVKIKNRILDLDLQSNASPVAFSNAINRHFKRYITEGFTEDSLVNPVNLKLDVRISQSPILNEVFLVNLEELDTIDVNVDFQEAERKMDASVSIPFVNYYNSKIDSLKLEMRSDPKNLNFNFAFNELNSGPLAIKETVIKGEVLDRKLNLDFSSTNEDTLLVHVNSELNFQGDTLKYHINQKDLILNKKAWEVDENNTVSYATNYIDFQDFRIYRNNQELKLTNDEPGVEKEHLGLSFKNFKLEALLNYLNPENQLASGELQGKFIYEEPFGETGLLADMEINQFKILDVDLNTLSLKGESAGFSTYDFDMAVKGGEVDLDLTGSYTAAEPSAQLDLELALNQVEMTALEGFSRGEIKNGSGSFSGNFRLNGTLLEPEYSGNLQFDNAGFNIAILDAGFVLPNENLRLDNQGVYFENFNINDAENNSIIVNGEVTTVDLLNPGFNLDVQAQDFRLLNSEEEDNELFYGTAVVDVDAQIKGDLNLPEVDMNLDIKERTDFTYVVPKASLQINERDGVVIFVNKENPDAILSQTEEESYVVSGYDIFTRISVNEDAKFNVIINPDTGDKFQVQGEGDLLFNMYPNGRTALTGVYEINDGFYEMSLYNLVKRRFDIANGSRVSWAGDPFDAQLDVTAIYRVETSASSLMASQTSSTDNNDMDAYRQKLPFLVYLNIDGELMSPKITFGLDMPEEEQGVAGGEIFGRVQQLNNQEQELNKQVFSLLVLNRFFPDSGSDGSSGGTLAVARDNLNSALSDQLNMLSSKILGESGVQLNFEVDSFTDYQGENPEDRTQLGINAQKAFLEDRLVVEVGSEVDIQGGNEAGQANSPLIGNVSISYLLNKSGMWRIKGFSKTQYENVVDGQLVVSGIALIFTKEFNKFKNMFEKAVMENVKDEEAEKDKKKDEK